MAGAHCETTAVQVLVADESSIVRLGLRSMLASPGLEVVGEAATPVEAVERVKALAPDVVVLGLGRSGLGLDSVRALRSASPGTAIVVLTEDPTHLLALLNSSTNCLSKSVDRGDLLAAVEAAAEGRSLVDQPAVMKALAAAIQAEQRKGDGPNERVRVLTPREREVLALITQGYTNRRIAEHLSVSVGTVKVHVCNILTKLRVADRVQAAVWATQHGLAARQEEPGA